MSYRWRIKLSHYRCPYTREPSPFPYHRRVFTNREQSRPTNQERKKWPSRKSICAITNERGLYCSFFVLQIFLKRWLKRHFSMKFRLGPNNAAYWNSSNDRFIHLLWIWILRCDEKKKLPKRKSSPNKKDQLNYMRCTRKTNSALEKKTKGPRLLPRISVKKKTFFVPLSFFCIQYTTYRGRIGSLGATVYGGQLTFLRAVG